MMLQTGLKPASTEGGWMEKLLAALLAPTGIELKALHSIPFS